ncbi:DUF3147 family protein [Acidisarcina polymorpha]|uniref:DUF3147 family protein n=1 Tax=Acidisarcina polymorpha TaxID=2211140 RepID=UPI00137533E5|nr:DUF3147 family protein [Acidisarcina polymorpha]
MIKIRFSSLKGTKAHEYLLRFLLGGLVTAGAGLIADQFGPVPGGLFMAFPAIFPAAATMLEKHEREKKQHAGLPPGKRGRMVAGVDAGGAALGTFGLAAFAFCVWKWLPRGQTWLVLVVALVCWFSVSTGLWWLRRRL